MGKLKIAERLRNNQNQPELLAGWWLRRLEELGGYHFEPQYVTLGWIADFWCEELYLVIEIDGLIHDDTITASRDEIKNTSLTRAGIAVARINADQDRWSTHLMVLSAIIARQRELFLYGHLRKIELEKSGLRRDVLLENKLDTWRKIARDTARDLERARLEECRGEQDQYAEEYEEDYFDYWMAYEERKREKQRLEEGPDDFSWFVTESGLTLDDLCSKWGSSFV